MGKKIENIPLNQLFIPGSHDSATYDLENKFAKGQDYSEKINFLKPLGVSSINTKNIKCKINQ